MKPKQDPCELPVSITRVWKADDWTFLAIQNTTSSDVSLFRHRPKIKKLSSRVSNGKAIFAIGGDGRSAWTRRWRDIFDQHISDLGGPDAGLSEAQISLCRRCAALAVELEQLEAKFSEGAADADLDLYARTSGHLSRLYGLLGIERRSKEATPDLRTYLASKDRL
jgi:hypothetical protein